jgi:hypothetical protein
MRSLLTFSNSGHSSVLRVTSLQAGGSFTPTSSSQDLLVVKFKLQCDRESVGQFILVLCSFWSGSRDVTFLWVTITFFLFHAVCPLWWEDRCVICSAMTQVQIQIWQLVLITQSRHKPHRKHHFQQLLHCCMHVCSSHYVMDTEPLPSKRHVCRVVH